MITDHAAGDKSPKAEGEKNMTAQEMEKQIEAQIPEGEQLDRMYRAMEGDVRVITKDKNGWETRYRVVYNKETDTLSLKQF